MAISARHELKYIITKAECTVLRSVIGGVLRLDPHAAKNGGQYSIRSLYFDDEFDSAYFDKINGVKGRNKYRIRVYNGRFDEIFMECKTKMGNLISKRSVKIPMSVAEQLIAGDPEGMEYSRSGLIRDIFREMRINLLRPKVIVDYDREAFLHPCEDVRITFDKKLRTGLNSIDIFNNDIPTIPVFENEEIVLEVKYNYSLPSYIADLLSYACPKAVQSAVSKYTMCRKYENLD